LLLILQKEKKIVPHIVLVGAGGNGGLILQHIAQMMSIFQLDGEIVVADPDTVEEKKCAHKVAFVNSDLVNQRVK
jgi:hypothetical protein